MTVEWLAAAAKQIEKAIAAKRLWTPERLDREIAKCASSD